MEEKNQFSKLHKWICIGLILLVIEGIAWGYILTNSQPKPVTYETTPKVIVYDKTE